MRRRRPQKQASKLHRGENYFGALRAFWELGGPSENLGVLLRETENPRPAEIRESSGEQFPLYRVAPGAAPLRPAKGGLSVKKGHKSDFCTAARHRAQRAEFSLGYH